MSFMCPQLTALRRPKLLADAARHGARLYKRKRDLKRLIGVRSFRKHEHLLDLLVQTEMNLDEDRRAKAETYSVTRHVLALSALVAESGAREAF